MLSKYFKDFLFVPFQFNVSHSIDHLSFGTDYPGQVNPLDHTEWGSEKCKSICNLEIVQLFVRIHKSEQCSDFGGLVGWFEEAGC